MFGVIHHDLWRANEEPHSSQESSKAMSKQISGSVAMGEVDADESGFILFVRVEIASEAGLPAIVGEGEGFHEHELVE